MTKQPNSRQYRNVCGDLLHAATSERYPVLVDRNAHPAVVLGCGVALVVAAGNRTDAGLPVLLNESTEMAYHSRSDLSDQERAVTKAVLALVWECHDKPPAQLFDRAFTYVAQRDLVNTLGLISVLVQMLAYIETLKPGVLADLDGELEMQAWVDAATVQLVTANDLEDLS